MSAVRRSRATFLPQLRLGVNRFGLDRIFDGTPGGGVAELASRRLGRVLAVALNVADRGQVDALVAAAEERFGAILIEQNDKWPVQRQRDLTRKTNSELSDGPLVSLTIMAARSEEHTSELQSIMRNEYAVFCS